MSEKIIENGPFRFVYSGEDAGAFRSALPLADDIIKNGKILKDSRTTTAATAEMPGFTGKVFIKRTNNKGFRFTFRYLFRRARAFRAARAAYALGTAGIPTPRVLAVGEKRVGPYLYAGYLITESLEAADCAAELFPDDGTIFEKTLELIAGMHSKAHMAHKDCKLQNFYFLNGECGVWDLDGARLFKDAPPEIYRLTDIARLVSSASAEMKERGISPDAGDLFIKAAEIYSAAAPECAVPEEAIRETAFGIFPEYNR